ncbi:MAG: inositol monophosphatase [Rhodobacteraceae bacterium]|nr:MAG: inositol monophosphatase [Paracoccaceae bacterium]
MNDEISERLKQARSICDEAGKTALGYFRRLDSLNIEAKGHQDLVSQADKEVELEIRAALAGLFPEDGIVGEEHAPVEGSSGYVWVIDPIDGTANFVAGIPVWCVVLACVWQGKTVLGVIHDPLHGETFHAGVGGGAFCNEAAMFVSKTSGINQGSVGVGFSNRSGKGVIARLVAAVVERGGLFVRNASGAMSLAYVAAGRLIGYSEDHMNAWDCLAGQLLVAEAGGVIEDQDADEMIVDGGRVIVGAPSVFAELLEISEAAFGDGD